MKAGVVGKLVALFLAIASVMIVSSLLVGTRPPVRQQADKRTLSADASGGERRPRQTTVVRRTGQPARAAASNLSKALKQTTGTAAGLSESSSRESAEGDEVDPLQQMSLEVRNNPRDIGLLIEELKKTTDPAKVAILAELIARNADLDELPVKDLFELARSENAAQRYAAMQILGKSERVSSEMLGMAEQMAKTDPNLAVRERCVTTMGEWMQKHGELSGKLCSTLIGVRDASEDAELRRYAIQTIKDSPAGVPAALVDALDASLRTETLAHNRSMAALALAYVEPSAAGVAVQKLQSAYMQEPSLDVKRHIITMIMRAGNVDAVNVLNKLPTPDPQLAQDVRDYAEIVQSGEQDIVKIIGLKLDRDLNRGTDTNGSPQ